MGANSATARTPIPGWTTGLFYGNDTQSSAAVYSTGALVANTLYAIWCATPPEGAPIDRIGAEITTSSAGKHFATGIYLPNGVRRRPGSLLLDSGALASDANGFIAATVAAQVPGGGVWLVILAEDAVMNFRRLGGAAIIAVQGKSAGGGTTIYGSLSVSQTYGALPATFPAGAVPNTNAMVINVRAA